MFLGAMVSAGLPLAYLENELGKLPVDGYRIRQQDVKKSGIGAVKIEVVQDNPDQPHRHFDDIVNIIESSSLAFSVKQKATDIFRTIGEAEAEIHMVDIGKVHFHEVGALDSIIDIVGAAIALDYLEIEKLYCSPINTGSGLVICAHGTMPVPAPATALILKNIPCYANGPEKELTTPTGAAIVKTLASGFCRMPAMVTENIGTGAGGYEIEKWPNILRVFIGNESSDGFSEDICELVCDIDDMNPQRYGQVMAMLYGKGALDVTMSTLIMKKGRPGMRIEVLSEIANSGRLCDLLLCNTTTIGVRKRNASRKTLPRTIITVDTEYGKIEAKEVILPNGNKRIMPEYESVVLANERHKVDFETVCRAVFKKIEVTRSRQE